jgi:hypothetical protein
LKLIVAGIIMSLIVSTANAHLENFDKTTVGTLPAGWTCGVTGKGNPRWKVEADASAPSNPNVLKQVGSGTFPWCVKSGAALRDGYVEVKFKSISGREDQAGGVVWCWKSADNYYVARANALENNVSLYYTENGNRRTIQYVDAPVTGNVWNTLRVNFQGTHIEVILNGKSYIQIDDNSLLAAGAVGVWTKADSVTAFDDFTYGAK